MQPLPSDRLTQINDEPVTAGDIRIFNTYEQQKFFIDDIISLDFDHYYFEWLNGKYMLKGVDIGTDELEILEKQNVVVGKNPSILILARPYEILRIKIINEILAIQSENSGSAICYNFARRWKRNETLREIYGLINEPIVLACPGCGLVSQKNIITDTVNHCNYNQYHYQANDIITCFHEHRTKCHHKLSQIEKKLLDTTAKYCHNNMTAVGLIDLHRCIHYSFYKDKITKYYAPRSTGYKNILARPIIYQTEKYILVGVINSTCDKNTIIDYMNLIDYY